MPTVDLDQPLDLGERDAGERGVEVRCEGVVHLYRTFAGHDVVALRGIDLTIAAGERVAFLGPSGCGKSTLLTLLGGIQQPSAGRIFFGDEEVSRLSERRLARVRSRLVSTMLQGATRNLLPYATAKQNLAFARLGGADRDDLPDPARLLELVGLADQRDQAVSTMSGGQRQRLALACAVSTGPRLLLADEPTSALGQVDRDAVVQLLHRIGTDYGTTVVVVTHQAEVAATFARTITMKGGRIGAEGRSGSEYAVVGEEGLLHLPTELVELWPAGTLVRIERDGDDRLTVSREDSATPVQVQGQGQGPA